MSTQDATISAHIAKAEQYLSRGEFDAGWQEYEWRLKYDDYANYKPPCTNTWDGRKIGKLLLVSEQGLGDILQFIRYAKLAKERAGSVIVSCRPKLCPLLLNCDGVDDVTIDYRPADYAAMCPLMSLPLVFGTTLATVPDDVPYIHPDRGMRWAWKQALRRKSDKFLLGINWRGSPENKDAAKRDIPADSFLSLSELPGVQLVNLQRGATDGELDALKAIRFPPSQFDSTFAFLDTAAVVSGLDLVVTSDTSIAHLAGALNVRTWLALPKTAEWRWLIDRDDSPWYPSMRLFRQTEAGDWNGVFERIAVELKKLI